MIEAILHEFAQIIPLSVLLSLLLLLLLLIFRLLSVWWFIIIRILSHDLLIWCSTTVHHDYLIEDTNGPPDLPPARSKDFANLTYATCSWESFAGEIAGNSTGIYYLCYFCILLVNVYDSISIPLRWFLTSCQLTDRLVNLKQLSKIILFNDGIVNHPTTWTILFLFPWPCWITRGLY